MRCYVDIDGVIADFWGAAFTFHGRPNPYAVPKHHDHRDLLDVIGLSLEEFWPPIAASLEFWKTVPLLPDARRILSLVTKYDPQFVLLSDHRGGPTVAAGKVEWVAENFPDLVTRLFLGTRKDLAAHSGALLIDDNQHNCENFRAASGSALLLPRPWNIAGISAEAVPTLERHLARWAAEREGGS